MSAIAGPARSGVPAILSAGFRPFFLLGALAMAGSVLVWIPVVLGLFEVPTAFSPRDWHVHTLLFGGVPAIVAGFALTAVANWTGRPHVAGRLLLALVLAWIAGRLAVSTSAVIGAGPAAAVDLVFPVALTAVFAREVIAGGNLRNLRVVALVGLLALADLCFHLEAAWSGGADISVRLALAIELVLVMLVGGRIVPAFTRNWLVARRAERLPAGFDRVDGVALALSAVALLTWTALPTGGVTAVLLALAGLANAGRLWRWRGWATRSEPLLFVLHLGYASLPLGFLAVAAAAAFPDRFDPASALHLWTVGTVGLMTLAVMTRASRGHSGRPLVAGRLEIAIYGLALAGALARAALPFAGAAAVPVLEAAGLAFAGAYLLFAVGYGPMLLGMGPGRGRA